MRSAYGKRAAQAGSLNSPGRMRFDFTAPAAVSPGVLSGVEEEVNDYLQNDVEVSSYTTTMDKAMELGAVALFGEKYGDQVRVVDMGDYSRELCGGTHVGRIGELGVVKLVSDSSVGSGVHRVEALVGMDAMRHISKEHYLVNQLAEQFKVPADQLPERIENVVTRLQKAEKELQQLRVQQVLSSAGELAGKATDVRGVSLVAEQVPDAVVGTQPEGLESPAVVLTVQQSKGLEFDSVLVVDPDGVLAESERGLSDLYVGLTRATQRLGVVHTGELPDVLESLS